MSELENKNFRIHFVRGWIFFTLWGVLILAGIVAKRVYGAPDLMVFFHLPAAVFLVLGFVELSYRVRLKRKEELKKIRQSLWVSSEI